MGAPPQERDLLGLDRDPNARVRVRVVYRELGRILRGIGDTKDERDE